MRRAIASITLALLACFSGGASGAESIVKTEAGDVRGASRDGVVAYLGLPYAAPPVGDRRWRPPARVTPWPEVRDATSYGPACPQPDRTDRAARGAGGPTLKSEDCLNLNVWSKAGARNAPVMVWIHGGGHRVGSNGLSIYDGSDLARHGVIVVSINYRLGLFGYFAHPALTAEAQPNDPLGNYGLMDQIAALEWVQRNIAAFGGDPKRVTVFGESAGGASILFLLTTQRAQGLFASAIVQSGGGLQIPQRLAEKEEAGLAAAARIGLDKSATAAALRATSADPWIDALGPLEGIGFGSFIDGRLVTEAPARAFEEGRAADVPLMIGANDNEGSIVLDLGAGGGFDRLGSRVDALRPAYTSSDDADFSRQVLGDAIFVAPSAWIAEQAAPGAPSYLYFYTYVTERRRGAVPGAQHAAEIPYVFQSLDRLPIPSAFFSDQDRAFSDMIASCWVSFARTGAPDCEGGPDWPAYMRSSDRVMVFAPKSHVAPHPRRKQMDAVMSLTRQAPD